jgi:hypothetical protein
LYNLLQMSDRFEVFDQFADTSDVSQALLTVGLTEDEAETAAHTIARHRAKFVVDSITQELMNRAVSLLDLRDQLESELTNTNEELAIIATSLGDESLSPAEQIVEEDDLEACKNWPDLRQAAEKRGTVTLWFDTGLSGSEPERWCDLNGWVDEHKNVIKARYGDRLHMFSRAAGIVDLRVSIDLNSLNTHEYVDDSERMWVGVSTEDFVGFCRQYSRKNFGVGCGIALLRIADMQKDEFPPVTIDEPQ